MPPQRLTLNIHGLTACTVKGTVTRSTVPRAVQNANVEIYRDFATQYAAVKLYSSPAPRCTVYSFGKAVP